MVSEELSVIFDTVDTLRKLVEDTAAVDFDADTDTEDLSNDKGTRDIWDNRFGFEREPERRDGFIYATAYA